MQKKMAMAALVFGTVGAGMAQAAAPWIETKGFHLEGAYVDPAPYNESFGGAAILSDSNGVARIALTDQQASLNANDTVQSNGPADGYHYTEWANTYILSVKQGYKVTGVTISGTAYGTQQAGEGGYVDSTLIVNFTLSENAWTAPAAQGTINADWLHGEAVLAAGTATGLGLDESYDLHFFSQAMRQAGSGSVIDPITGETVYRDSISAIGVRDLTLNISYAPINVSAVPEPGSWLMLSSGLLAVAATRRRRKR